MSTAAIMTKRLTKTYGANRGIRDMDIDVREGEIFGFLGPNGAGKSTTMRTLLGFMAPTSGTGRIFRMGIVEDSVAIRQHVGNLPGEFSMEDRLTGRERVELFAHLRGVEDLGFMEAGAIASAEERGILDILFGNPLPRATCVLAYWLAVAAMMMLMLLTMGLASWGAAAVVDVGLSF